MEFTAAEITQLLQGKLDGDPEVKVWKLAKIEEGEKGALSFLANPKYTAFVYTTSSSIVLVNDDFEAEQSVLATIIRVPDAYSAFARLLEIYNEVHLNKTGISDKAYIAPSATLGKNLYIGEFAFIGDNARIGDNSKIYPQVYIGENSSIGDNTTLFPGVKIYSETQVGCNCTFHAGVVVGSDGFGFAPQQENDYKKIAQIGNVIIEDNVEIGANTTIDRATLGSTIIRKGVKLDNLIQVGHNAEIGENTIIAAQTGIAGSAKIGRNCIIAGQVGIAGHITIADNVKVAAQSGIGSSNIKAGSTVMGSPAFDIERYRKSYIHFRNLQKLNDKIDSLEKQLLHHQKKD
ncbi:MAG: UDP-3-O-(3-hydroxymyristoyl)glucosamine N-acyltransferase [Bacteroidales bacterium]